jgi:hypothetical protein
MCVIIVFRHQLYANIVVIQHSSFAGRRFCSPGGWGYGLMRMHVGEDVDVHRPFAWTRHNEREVVWPACWSLPLSVKRPVQKGSSCSSSCRSCGCQTNLLSYQVQEDAGSSILSSVGMDGVRQVSRLSGAEAINSSTLLAWLLTKIQVEPFEWSLQLHKRGLCRPR